MNLPEPSLEPKDDWYEEALARDEAEAQEADQYDDTPPRSFWFDLAAGLVRARGRMG